MYRRKAILMAIATLACTVIGCKPRTAAPEPVSQEKTTAASHEKTATVPHEQAPADNHGEPPLDKHVVMIIACKDFRDEELAIPKKILEDAGAEVTVASTSTGTCTGMMGAKISPDITLEDVKTDDYDAMIFVGGTGSTTLYDDETALELARQADREGLILGAICLAPGILAKAGVLQGKKATAYEAEQTKKAFEEGKATFTGANVTVDGVMITANGPDAAKAFGEKLEQMLR